MYSFPGVVSLVLPPSGTTALCQCGHTRSPCWLGTHEPRLAGRPEDRGPTQLVQHTLAHQKAPGQAAHGSLHLFQASIAPLLPHAGREL